MNHNNNFAVLRDDPAALLHLFDPATVAIRAGADGQTLEQMSTFAHSLVRYLSLVQSQQQQRQHQQQQAPPAAANHENAAAAAAAAPPQQHQEEHQEPVADAVASNPETVAAEAAPEPPPEPPTNAPVVVVKQEPEESVPNPSASTHHHEHQQQPEQWHGQQPEQWHEQQQHEQQQHHHPQEQQQDATLTATVQIKQEPETETETGTTTEPPTPEELPSCAPTDTSTENNDNEEEGGQEGEPEGNDGAYEQDQDSPAGYGPPTEEAEEALEKEGQANHSHPSGQEVCQNTEADNAAGVGRTAQASSNEGEKAAQSDDEALARRRSGRQPKPKKFYPCEGRVSCIVDVYATGANEETDDDEKSRKQASVESQLGGMASLQQPASLKRRTVSPARLTMEEELKEKKPAPTKKKPKIDKKIEKEEAEKEEEKIPATKISPTIVGIKDTVVRRSAGNTREFLNKHLVKLGLSCFGQGVVSGKQGKISHLTLTMNWNDLPKNEDGKLFWYLGEGERRLRLAQPLDPAENDQTPLPIFWAEKAKQKGGSLCFYVGHFKCVRFEKYGKENRVVYKQGAQALLEFEFIKFDEDLSMKLMNVAALSNPTTI